MSKIKESYEDVLLQLFEDGYATTVVDLIPGKLSVTLKTIGAYDQIAIEKEMEDVRGSGPVVIHTYGLKLLAATLVKYGDVTFGSRGEAADYLEKVNLTSALVDKLVKSQNILEKMVRKALKLEEVDKVFFDQASRPDEPKQSLKDTMSASEAV